MTSNHKEIMSELCSIIEQFVLTDVNEESSILYRRTSQFDFTPKFSRNDAAIVRFKTLLSTPDLDVSTSTSEENSLIAHVFMYICLVVKYATRYPNTAYSKPSLFRTRHLLALLVAHPRVNVNVDFYITWPDTMIECQLIIAHLIHRHAGLIGFKDYAPFESIFNNLVIDDKMEYEDVWWSMAYAKNSTAQKIVNNIGFDLTFTSDLGETVFGAVIQNYHRDAVEDMLKMPEFQPNLLAPLNVDHEPLRPLDYRDPRIHYVLHAAGGFPKYEKRASSRMMKRLVRAVLGHVLTDISRVRPHSNGASAVNADSMYQMMQHDTFDMHNIVILSQKEIDRENHDYEDDVKDVDSDVEDDEQGDEHGNGDFDTDGPTS